MNVDQHAGHGILFQAKFTDEEAVRYVLRTKDQFHFAIHRNADDGRDDIVLPVRIGAVQPDRVPRGSAYELRLDAAELAVGAGIAEVPGKLLRGDLDLEIARGRRLVVDLRPGILTIKPQTDKENHRGNRPDDFHGGIAFEMAGTFATMSAIAENHPRQNELRPAKDDPGDP